MAAAGKRRRLAVEVIQSSAMDCGPAALRCLLESHGLPISYGRLREACQTDVDGTSIDTLEEIAVSLGLEAEQIMVPVEHVCLREAASLPAIAVVLTPGGMTHFVVIWSARAGWVQIMDPAQGRLFIRESELLRRLFVHRMPAPAEAFREWAGSEQFLAPLRRRMRDLGVAPEAEAWLGEALADPGWRSLARLDAAVRMVAALRDSGGLRGGEEARRVLARLLAETRELDDAALLAAIPEPLFTAAPDEDPSQVLLRGAVLVRVTGVRPDGPALDRSPAALAASGLSGDLVAALREPPHTPLRELWRLALRSEAGEHNPAARLVGLVLLGTVAAALAVLAEAVVLRGVVDLGARLGAGERLGAATIVAMLFVGFLALELPVALAVRQLGRHLDARARVAFVTAIPRLGDRYLASRPISDMAERVHMTHALRGLPAVLARLARAGCELLFTALALIWLAPAGAPWVGLAAVCVVMVPLALNASLAERDLRVRSHAGAIARFYLDALLGLTAIRTHGAERSLRREHEGLMVEWSRAFRGFARLQIAAVGVSQAVGFGLAIVLFAVYLGQRSEPAGALLLIYWALALPAIGERLAAAAFELPGLRNTALRLVEPLNAPGADEPVNTSPATSATGGAALEFSQVGVLAGGHPILHELELTIAAGEHVAVVGRSGAGKSSLLGLLLGWHRAHTGAVTVDGAPLDVTALRQVTAWVDPAVALWNRTLLENLRYGNPDAQQLADALARADLQGVLERLPDGLQTTLGEGGGLVSGGEGQRVRLGRALLRAAPRLVLLDEPFRGLDRHARGELLTAARAAWQDATLLCVTHDIDAALGFPRVLVIEDGRVVEDGEPRALLEREHGLLRGLLAAERDLAATGWGDPVWRRIELERGELREEARA